MRAVAGIPPQRLPTMVDEGLLVEGLSQEPVRVFVA
jgi:hypothetical protein